MAEDDVQVLETEGSTVEESTTSTEDQSTSQSDSGAWPAEVQAEFTKKTQALAEERRGWENDRFQQQQQMQQYQQQLQQYANQMQQQQHQSQQQGHAAQQQGLLDQLRTMPYLDGNTAAQLMERIMGEGISPLQQQLQQRDQTLAQMHKEYKALKEQVGSSQTRNAEAELNGRFQTLREEHGLPDEPWANDYLKDVYFSHEGKDLNKQYPEMVRTRLETMRKGFREMDRRVAEKAKTTALPFKGGEASLTSGKDGGYKTAQERADELWPMLNPGQTE